MLILEKNFYILEKIKIIGEFMKKFLFFSTLLFVFHYLNVFSQPVLQFASLYNGPGANKLDNGVAVTTDASGNVYVTGASYRTYDYKSSDIVTIKYNSSGIEQWTVRYNGTNDSVDYPCAIAVDLSGNVYVLGKSSTSSGDRIIVIKYNSSGTQQWVYLTNYYSDPRYSVRWLTLDGSGNVFATSNFFNTYNGSQDYVTIKLNSSGVLQWSATYNGANNADVPEAIKVDGSGNVYVTGSSINSAGNNDYLTIKYSPSGTVLWTSRYNPFNQTDIANDIAIDSYGYIYVTGSSSPSNSIVPDYATIKYNYLTGDSMWVQRYNQNFDVAHGIAIDGLNYVYVTGTSDNHITTIKYSSTGVQQWIVNYSGAGPWDYGNHIKVDQNNNVFIAGNSYAGSSPRDENYLVIKYNSAGTLQWANIYDGPSNDRDELNSIVVDQFGNIIVTGFSYAGKFNGTLDYATVKYTPSGTVQWVQRYNGPVPSFDVVRDICKDYNGNIIVTGESDGGNTVGDILTIKFAPNGDTLWTRRIDGSAYSIDQPTAVCVDRNNNIYVSGVSWSGYQIASMSMVLLKYSPTGSLQWISFPFGYTSGYTSSLASVGTDNNGNVYATGTYRYGSGLQFSSIYTFKFNPSTGDTLFSRYYQSTTPKGNEARKLIVDSSNYIYVLGTSGANGWDYVVIKYNSNGDTLWTATYNGTGNSYDVPSDITVDMNGNIYVTGLSRSGSTAGTEDIATVKYNANGVQQWVNRYNGSGNGLDVGNSIYYSSGYVYVAGTTYRSGTNSDYIVIKYNAITGDTIWTKIYNGVDNSTDFATSVIVNNSSNVFAAGTVHSGNKYQLGILGLNNSGNQQWTLQYNTNRPPTQVDSSYSVPTKILLADQNSFYVAASTYQNNTYDYLLLKYNLQTDIRNTSTETPEQFVLYQNYPNPFNLNTTIKFDLPRKSNVEMSIYDITGKLVKTLLKEEKNAGSYNINFDATNLSSGIYIYKLITPEITFSRRMILIK